MVELISWFGLSSGADSKRCVRQGEAIKMVPPGSLMDLLGFQQIMLCDLAKIMLDNSTICLVHFWNVEMMTVVNTIAPQGALRFIWELWNC